MIELLRDRPPRAGQTRVLAIDGRSGSGKTTLADQVAAALDAPIVRLEDLYEGWDGLLAGVQAAHDWLLAPLAAGRPAGWHRYDWYADSYAEWHPVEAPPELVLEGVGAGARLLAPYVSALVWVEAPDDVRRARALARDGEMYLPHWDRWAAHEETFYAANDVRSRADLVINTD